MTNLHPYKQEYLEAPLRFHKLKLECLHKRIALMPAGETDYEKNEVILEKMKTTSEIKALSNIIAEREAYYLNYWNKVFVPDVEDMEENIGTVLTKAHHSKDEEVKALVAKLTFEVQGNVNIENKIHLYKLLKKKLAE